ncbi:MAG: hypothetical protein V1853_03390 [bacterium]
MPVIDNQNQPRPEEVRVSGQPLGLYWRAMRLGVLIVTTLEIILIITDRPAVYLWTINMIFFLYLGWWLHSKKLITFGSAITMGMLSGFTIGIFVAIFRLAWERKAFLFFGLITEPLITAAGGLLLGALAFTIFKPKETIEKNIPKQESKGKGVKPDVGSTRN